MISIRVDRDTTTHTSNITVQDTVSYEKYEKVQCDTDDLATQLSKIKYKYLAMDEKEEEYRFNY